MLWPVFSWEVRLDHCNGPSRSLAQWCLISFPTLSCTEKRKFKRNKSGSKILHILNISQDYQPSAEVFRGRSSARRRSSINWQKLMKLCLVCRIEPALVWEIAVGSLWALVGLQTRLCGTVPLCVVHQILSCCRQCLGKWIPFLRCCRQCLGRPFFVFLSQQQSPGSDQEQQCHVSAHHESQSLTEIHPPPSGPKLSIYVLSLWWL